MTWASTNAGIGEILQHWGFEGGLQQHQQIGETTRTNVRFEFGAVSFETERIRLPIS